MNGSVGRLELASSVKAKAEILSSLVDISETLSL